MLMSWLSLPSGSLRASPVYLSLFSHVVSTSFYMLETARGRSRRRDRSFKPSMSPLSIASAFEALQVRHGAATINSTAHTCIQIMKNNQKEGQTCLATSDICKRYIYVGGAINISE